MSAFDVPECLTVRIAADTLRTKAAAIFHGAGVPADDARLAADVLVTADLRGVDTHGVSNMLPRYLQLYEQGTLNHNPAWRIIRETPGTANIDADRGLGLIVAPKAMQLAMEKARDVGIGFVTVHHGGHLGMAQYHSLLATKQGMIGICLTATGPLVVPTFGREPRVGTNPIAVAVPCGQEPPFVFDAATTVVAGNKIVSAHRLGLSLPPGLLADQDGTPIMHTIPAPKIYSRLLPLGSTPALGSHKGYGLACVVEILTHVLGGLTFAARLGHSGYSHCLAAVDIRAFVDPDAFARTMDEYLQALKATPPALNQERVLVPGQLEWETEQVRREQGIPLHREVAAWIESACSKLCERGGQLPQSSP